jgi:TfoX/Sxy family transcriptional regulator of competence genes
MATSPDTIEFILEKLRYPSRFKARAMFGEYALYADGKVVALVCDDLLYVKIMPESQELAGFCDTGAPYPGARPHYVIEEDQLSKLESLPAMLLAMARALPKPKPKKKKGKKGKSSK